MKSWRSTPAPTVPPPVKRLALASRRADRRPSRVTYQAGPPSLELAVAWLDVRLDRRAGPPSRREPLAPIPTSVGFLPAHLPTLNARLAHLLEAVGSPSGLTLMPTETTSCQITPPVDPHLWHRRVHRALSRQMQHVRLMAIVYPAGSGPISLRTSKRPSEDELGAADDDGSIRRMTLGSGYKHLMGSVAQSDGASQNGSALTR